MEIQNYLFNLPNLYFNSKRQETKNCQKSLFFCKKSGEESGQGAFTKKCKLHTKLDSGIANVCENVTLEKFAQLTSKNRGENRRKSPIFSIISGCNGLEYRNREQVREGEGFVAIFAMF